MTKFITLLDSLKKLNYKPKQSITEKDLEWAFNSQNKTFMLWLQDALESAIKEDNIASMSEDELQASIDLKYDWEQMENLSFEDEDDDKLLEKDIQILESEVDDLEAEFQALKYSVFVLDENEESLTKSLKHYEELELKMDMRLNEVEMAQVSELSIQLDITLKNQLDLVKQIADEAANKVPGANFFHNITEDQLKSYMDMELNFLLKSKENVKTVLNEELEIDYKKFDKYFPSNIENEINRLKSVRQMLEKGYLEERLKELYLSEKSDFFQYQVKLLNTNNDFFDLNENESIKILNTIQECGSIIAEDSIDNEELDSEVATDRIRLLETEITHLLENVIPNIQEELGYSEALPILGKMTWRLMNLLIEQFSRIKILKLVLERDNSKLKSVNSNFEYLNEKVSSWLESNKDILRTEQLKHPQQLIIDGTLNFEDHQFFFNLKNAFDFGLVENDEDLLKKKDLTAFSVLRSAQLFEERYRNAIDIWNNTEKELQYGSLYKVIQLSHEIFKSLKSNSVTGDLLPAPAEVYNLSYKIRSVINDFQGKLKQSSIECNKLVNKIESCY
ncbi:hypothetical protein HK099_004331 [Clydaea vesicula]|uniref:Uncharacterized protein n=1 Tax=Clydaea vesicula TaxID=447962 RepID=A0AAD5Y1B9_9FUNG|nr:hypothetical protein HK099_004331 [Clydaea vesicula]